MFFCIRYKENNGVKIKTKVQHSELYSATVYNDWSGSREMAMTTTCISEAGEKQAEYKLEYFANFLSQITP